MDEVLSIAVRARRGRIMGQPAEISRDRIAATDAEIRRYLRWTPLLKADLIDFGLAQAPVIFKLEMLQHSGSFKARGAFANLLLRKPPPAGVVAASGGNHGAAPPYPAPPLRAAAAMFLPRDPPPPQA